MQGKKDRLLWLPNVLKNHLDIPHQAALSTLFNTQCSPADKQKEDTWFGGWDTIYGKTPPFPRSSRRILGRNMETVRHPSSLL